MTTDLTSVIPSVWTLDDQMYGCCAEIGDRPDVLFRLHSRSKQDLTYQCWRSTAPTMIVSIWPNQVALPFSQSQGVCWIWKSGLRLSGRIPKLCCLAARLSDCKGARRLRASGSWLLAPGFLCSPTIYLELRTCYWHWLSNLMLNDLLVPQHQVA